MTLIKQASLLAAIGCTLMAGSLARAQAPAQAIDPDWANSAWYAGGSIGAARATVEEQRVRAALSANGSSVTAFGVDEKDAVTYKLLVGRQLNRHFAIEGGYFDLGRFGFDAITSDGALSARSAVRGVNLDLVGKLPLGERVALIGRLGMQYAKTTTDFSGNRLNAVSAPHASERKLNPKIGIGLELKLTEALAMRAEAERYRIDDAIGNRGDIDMFTVGLVYKFGRTATPTQQYAAAIATAPLAEVAAPAAPAPPPAPVPVSEKVTFAAEALFDFDRANVKPEGAAALDALLAKLQGMNTEVIVTVGYTDSVGSDAYNEKLSQRRGEAVKAYLAAHGVDAARVYTEGKGESQPVADNSTEEGRARNRRVTVEVVGTRSVAR
jgi:OmpA-OmpF porin, OOP family